MRSGKIWMLTKYEWDEVTGLGHLEYENLETGEVESESREQRRFWTNPKHKPRTFGTPPRSSGSQRTLK